jgi:hypothetical protein
VYRWSRSCGVEGDLAWLALHDVPQPLIPRLVVLALRTALGQHDYLDHSLLSFA